MVYIRYKKSKPQNLQICDEINIKEDKQAKIT